MVEQKSQTFPSSPTHSSSSSDFEFAVSTSPQKSSAVFCPADDLFYKGKLLPLHLSPRLSMVQTIILASSSTSTSSSSDSAPSRDSTASRSSNESSFSGDVNPLASVDFHHSRTSSVAGDDELNRLKKRKFSISRISSVLKKEPKQDNKTGSYKEVIRGCLKKVKPLFEKLSLKQPEHGIREEAPGKYSKQSGRKVSSRRLSNSFSGNLVYPRRKMPATCPSSPNHHRRLKSFSNVSSSMEELQNAIQGAITHCKDSMKLDG